MFVSILILNNIKSMQKFGCCYKCFLFVIVCFLFTMKGIAQVGQAKCDRVVSAVEDPTSAQMAGSRLPVDPDVLDWFFPADFTRQVSFSGIPGHTASHEGVDYVHDSSGRQQVFIYAAAKGLVVYVREGCPESSLFKHNEYQRECGAGWGNHVVIKHGNIFTRYAHLRKKSIRVSVGDSVCGGEAVAQMGNSGRSEVRHLHFELGTRLIPFNACELSQNFDYVYNPAQLDYQKKTGIENEVEDILNLHVEAGDIVLEVNNARQLQEIDSVMIYDVEGQLLLNHHFERNNVKGCRYTINGRALTPQHVFICHVVLNGEVVVKKFRF